MTIVCSFCFISCNLTFDILMKEENTNTEKNCLYIYKRPKKTLSLNNCSFMFVV